jgi:uncharacterized protein YfdQ (DUF2303 family)
MEQHPINESSLAAAIAAGVALAAPHQDPDQHGRSYVLVPPGYELATLEPRGKPEHPKALVKLRDTASFIRYFNDHRTPASRIFASLEPARFLAIFDEIASDYPDVADSADWREFRATFDVPASREWKVWNEKDRKPMSQLAFAEFLQDNLPDVVEPGGAELLEMALNFEAAQSGQFVSAQRLSDGSQNLQWKTDNSGTVVRLPERIALSVPVFENETPSSLDARLRYRSKDGTLTFWYELVRPHKVLELAFRAAWQRIATDTEAVILLGSPE